MTESEWSALVLSIQVAIAAVSLGLGPAIGIAWLLARKRFFGKSLVESFVALPLVLPPVVTGYVLLLVFGRTGWFGGPLFESLGVSLAFSWLGAALASAVVGFPLAVRAIRQSFEAIDPRLEAVASTLGATPRQRFFRISLPLALPGVLTGGILAFARSLGEFGATIAFVGNIPGRTQTLPLAVYSAIQQPGGEAPAARLVIISVVLAICAVALSERLSTRA